MALQVSLQRHTYTVGSPWGCTACDPNGRQNIEPAAILYYAGAPHTHAICTACLSSGRGLKPNATTGTVYVLPDGRSFEVGRGLRSASPSRTIVLALHQPGGWTCTSARGCNSGEPVYDLWGTAASFTAGKAICRQCLAGGWEICSPSGILPVEYFDRLTIFFAPPTYYQLGIGPVKPPDLTLTEPLGTPACRCDFSKGLWGVHQADCAWRAAGGAKLEKIRVLEQQIAALRGKP